MIDHSQAYFLQLVGRGADHAEHHGRPRPIGDRVFLQPGTFASMPGGPGATNQACLPLAPAILQRPWTLEAYELWDAPEAGQRLAQLRLRQPVLFHRPTLEALPPCAIQLGQDGQPGFEISRLERNPCPGWSERIHLYQNPGQPFEASGVIYLDAAQQVGAAELFNVKTRSPLQDGTMIPRRRLWIRYTY